MTFYPSGGVSTAPSGPAGGSLTGTYPNPGVLVGGVAVTGPAVAGSLASATAAATGKWGAAPLVAKPANPTGNSTTSLLMCGCAVAFTPAGSGIVQVVISAACTNSAVGSNNTVGARFGTGTAPINGAAVTGTRIGPSAADYVAGDATVFTDPFTITDILTLVAGTTYWFDLCQASSAATTVTIVNISMSIIEL